MMLSVLARVVFVAIASAHADFADEMYVDIPLNQVPKPVAQAVMKKYPEAQPQSASRGFENSQPFYDVFIKVKGQNIWVTCDSQGVILQIDREIAVKELPRPVVAALEKKYSKAAVRLVNEIVEDGRAAYDIAITFNKRPLVATFSADGQFLGESEDDEPAAVTAGTPAAAK